jgi:hypothetical protein
MHLHFAQTYTVSGKQISAGTFYGSIALVAIGLLSLRLLLDALDRARIRSHVRGFGGQILKINWSPFGEGWFGDESDRIYTVTYRTKAGKTIAATCKTSMFSGVYWTSDTLPDSFPSQDTDSCVAERPSCGATILESTTCCPKCGWNYKDSSRG